MSKKKKREREERKMLHHKAEIGVVLEQCSNPELAVIIRFLERIEYDAAMKIALMSSAAYDIRAARRAERIAERAAARKLNRAQKFEKEDKPPLEPVPQVPIPDTAQPEH